MIKNIVCWCKAKIGDCYYFNIKTLDEKIRITQLCLNAISNQQKQIDKCIEHNDIEEVLRLSSGYINELYWYEIKEKEWDKVMKNEKNFEDYLKDNKSNCKLDTRNCTEKFISNKEKSEELSIELQEKIEKYNKVLAIVKQVQNH
jgi:hypothetical protein